ncbi:MAG TPA: hypothetical protein PLD47_13265 [Aggregatilineales bacterium]|nr:glycoside hydrolase family 65 protein [Anaerolineales bacterium]HRE48688.1 hypothetical protein [Aggregatilineales bacterium]
MAIYSAEERTWRIGDAPFNPFKLAHTETIYTIGNGYMGLRGTFEEDYPGSMVSTLVHGIFNHADGDLVPDLVNCPNPLPLRVVVDGEEFSQKTSKVLGYERALNLKTATLTRGVLWQTTKGTVVQLLFERFASLENQHLLVQRVSVRPLTGNALVRVCGYVDHSTTKEGVNHWASLTNTAVKGRVAAKGITTQSAYEVAVMSALLGSEGQITLVGGDRPTLQAEGDMTKNEAFVIVKLSAIHTSRDAADPIVACQTTLAAAEGEGYDALKAAHEAQWAAYWHASDIEIEGDEPLQRALRFTTYHILIAAPRHEERASIGAKTLSGPGYKGHVFWDTELFIIPPLILTQPELARNLLMYRYHNLPGARNKAKKAGYAGAMFPWESTDTGEETTPQWTHPLPDGSRIRIWTGDNEQHISADVAYAVMMFWEWTGDHAWFARYGAEIVLDTAVFWGSRVEYKADKDRYELSMQIGPDEYHDNVNNSAFTNSMVRWHLQTAIRVARWVQSNYTKAGEALLTRLSITPAQLETWATIAEKMYIPTRADGLIEQYDGFFNLEPVDLSLWTPKVANYDAIVGHHAIQNQMVIKQADLVMLIALLGDAIMTPEEQAKHWAFYYPLADHGSSLSPATHAQVAARLRNMDDAYHMLSYAAAIDLDDLKGNVHDGIHAAAAGGLWQAVVFGFCGLKLADKGVTTTPHFPPHWRKVRFRIQHGGREHEVVLTP